LLLSLIPISFLFPLVNGLFPSISQVIIDVPAYDGIIFTETAHSESQQAMVQNATVNYWSVLTLLYSLGVGFSFFRLLFNIRKLFLAKRKSTVYQKEGYKLVVSDSSQIFSFFNWIFIPKEKINSSSAIVLEHEKAHVKLKHSIDVVITELYVAFFWFNPLVYFFRNSLKSIHEFQADKNVIDQKIKPSDYLQQLLQNLEINKPNTMSSYFNYPILKRRINMITKTKSTRFTKLRYLLLLPICVLFLFAFTSKKADIIKEITTDNASSNQIDPPKNNSSIPSLFPVKNKSAADITAFYGIKWQHPVSKKETVHGGIDIGAKTGTPVVATADGTISKANLEGDWGNLIVITHSNDYQTWYAHLDGFNIKENQIVKKGDIIGFVGTTGQSTSPHLHYEVKQNGERVNPMDYLME
jgi:murein DD-endopeptidase MepM/ murein hydrolase activator NlpD